MNLNKIEKKAYKNFYWAGEQLIGELENETYDYPEESKEYQDAMSKLGNEQYLLDTMYEWGISSIFGEGYQAYDGGDFLTNIRFLGKERLMEIVKLAYKEIC